MGSGASKSITCPICTEKGFTNQQFVQHYRKTHNKQCTKCGLSGFESDNDMHKHYDQVHNNNNATITCRKCSKKYTDEEQFLGHMESEHNFRFNSSQVTLNGGEKPVCPECGKSKKNHEKLQKHAKKNHEFKCSKCIKGNFKTLEKLQKHNDEEHQAVLKCPIKCKATFSNVDDFIQHLSDDHNFAFIMNSENNNLTKEEINCPKCGQNVSYSDLIHHVETVHFIEKQQQQKNPEPKITCPKCMDTETKFTSTDELLQHMKTEHDFSSTVQIKTESGATKTNLPKVGDNVLAMWEVSVWQYFTAKIKRIMPGKIQYEIDWDDGDTTGRYVDYHNLAVDRAPEESEIGVGSVVLFPQGGYTAGATQLTGGKRWHQGRITKVHRTPTGETRYDGVHTKGQADGKFSTYKGYSYEFLGFFLRDLRIGPNVFDILDEDTGNTDIDISDVDIYFSYNDVSGGAEDECKPQEIAQELKSKGINVVESREMQNEGNLSEKVKFMKNAKVFVACISDDYVQNQTCRMEFQYAKSTLKKPVVPLVFGPGREWMLSVVGMLISGELYIEFKDKSIKDKKVKSMLKSISTHLGREVTDHGTGNTNESENVSSKNNQKPGDIFLSYCWANSNLAFENNQISNLKGNKLADPRVIKEELTNAGYNTWLDIERLRSGDHGVGMFEQLAAALKEAKVVVACISDEYANSVNCRMEFQFACKALQKPIIPLVVGSGNEWNETVIGMLIKMDEHLKPISLQTLNSESDFKTAVQKITSRVKEILGKGQPQNLKVTTKSRKPKVGDHVISHHFTHCYYTATVVAYDASTMEYQVKWDDGDTSGLIQKYNQVARNEIPDSEDVGVDSVIFFPQGEYVFAGIRCLRYHEGIVTKVHSIGHQVFLDGHHTKGESDGKYLGYKNYDYGFHNISVRDARIAPSALDTMA